MFDNNPELDALLKELETPKVEDAKQETSTAGYPGYTPTQEEIDDAKKMLAENGIREIPREEAEEIIRRDKEKIYYPDGTVTTGNGDYLLEDSYKHTLEVQKNIPRTPHIIPEEPEEDREKLIEEHLESKIPGEYSDDEIIKAEDEFINDYLAFEIEIKETKQRFKELTKEYQLRGVNTRVVSKIVKQIARDNKKSNFDLKDETRVSNRLFRDKGLISKIVSALN